MMRRRKLQHPTKRLQDKSVDLRSAHVVGTAGLFGISAPARAVSHLTLFNNINALCASFRRSALEIGHG
jgi:hypothetical protein